MITTLKTRLLPFFFILLLGTLASCEKDDNNSGITELLSFGPTGAMHGDTLRIIGNNLNDVTAVEFTGAVVEKSGFVEQTSERILIILPPSVEQGFITLKTPAGDIVSKTRLNLEVPVTITSIPASARPGDNITIKGEYMNWVTQVWFEKDKMVDSFVSKSLNELVVKIPMDAQSGKITLIGSGTEPMEVESETTLNVMLPAITSLNPNPVEREKNLTINGTDLDLVKGVMFKGKPTADTTFESRSATQLVIKVPKEADRGKIELVAFSGVKIESAEDLKLVGDLPALDDFPLAIYTDGLENGFQDWSWAVRDFNSTGKVRQGTKSIKVIYGGGGYEGLTFHNDNGPATGNYSKLEFSVFGDEGSAGKKLNLIINGNWGAQYQFSLVEGEWRTFSFNLADIGNPSQLKEIVIQSAGWTGIVYVDHVGLR